jgi:CheY-like chemotaxis protein
MTAATMLGVEINAIAAGMNDYISKPVKPHELQTVLRK